ncbi:hypothetical protein ACIHCQ_29180 [Streptomyces sp. NPDC052236]|uniref:hypothetical protein n=1 Tax=Streptomyces sp. NPDC052236 TaxID=3365686 RepID=UPI0037D02C96
MISRSHGLLRVALTGTATVALAAGAFAVAGAATPGSNPAQAQVRVQAAADEAPPAAIEDFNYPGAAKILQERGLKVFRGDGRILVAHCDGTANQIQIWSRVGDEGSQFCFQATGTSGYLTVEIPEVFALQTTDRPISAELTAGGKTQTVSVAKDTLKDVGEGSVGAPTMLVELRVTG